MLNSKYVTRCFGTLSRKYVASSVISVVMPERLYGDVSHPKSLPKTEKLDEDARVIWGAQIYKDMEKTIRTMLIVTGVKSSQIFGSGKKTAEKKKKEIEQHLGIEFLD